jgi:UDP-N-acetylmuramate dehydrogenase
VDNEALKNYTTFKLGGVPQGFVRVHDKVQLPDLVKRYKDVWILGGGSNTIFTDAAVPFTVLKVEIPGVRVVGEDAVSVLVEVGAGEVWDALVAYTCKQGWSGLESLSGIPGTVGAAPIQNIGAYGAEVAEVIDSIEVYDRALRTFRMIYPPECKFGYRTSMFKTYTKHLYIITSITLRLSKLPPMFPRHHEIAVELNMMRRWNAQDIRAAILRVRQRKLANPAIMPNAGSFFQNPTITKNQKDNLVYLCPTIPVFGMPNNIYKIPAAWLLERGGYKGRQLGHFQFSPQHALILTHLGNGTMQELIAVTERVVADIYKKFNVILTIEPEFVLG